MMAVEIERTTLTAKFVNPVGTTDSYGKRTRITIARVISSRKLKLQHDTASN